MNASSQGSEIRRAHRRRTAFGVVELFPDTRRHGGWRLLLDGVVQSYVDTADPAHLDYPALRWVARLADRAAGERVLHLGAGAMSIPRYLAARRPGIEQEIVDINPGLLDLVGSVLPPLPPGTRIRVADALQALAAAGRASVDLVVVDVFIGGANPAHTTGSRMVELARQALSPGGMLVVNVADGGDLVLSRRQWRSMTLAFGYGYLIGTPAVLHEGRRGNVVLAGVDRPLDGPTLASELSGGELVGAVSESMRDSRRAASPAADR